MSTMTVAPTVVSTRPFAGFPEQCRKAFREWRERRKVCAALLDLNSNDLKDMGIARGDIEYVACNRAIDPRSAVSNGR
jgi:uncharacterized protein YjiS (DUF1127 family)